MSSIRSKVVSFTNLFLRTKICFALMEEVLANKTLLKLCRDKVMDDVVY